MPGAVRVSWGQDAEVRSSGRERVLGPQWPTVEQLSQDEEDVLLWSKEELWVKITVCPRLQLISDTQPTSTLSRIKCEIYIFYKEVCSFVHWNSSLCLIMFRIYLYTYTYTNMQLYMYVAIQTNDLLVKHTIYIYIYIYILNYHD